jgi:4-carboxymuconolactone decarboxylase
MADSGVIHSTTKRKHPMAAKAGKRSKAYIEGLKVRRRWLGKAYVDRAFRNADDFTIDLQHYVTEHAWGASWARGVLPMKTRAFMNLAMISALNRPHELEIHLRAAIRNGMTKAEIKEAFLHVAVYCGAPAALDSFRIAKQIFAEQAPPRARAARR